MALLISNNVEKNIEKSDNSVNSEKSKNDLLCLECNEFFGTPQTDNKCSFCFLGKDKVLCYRDHEFRKMLDQYVETKLASKTNQNLLKKSLKKKTSGPIRYVLDVMNKNDTYITAKFGYELKMILNKMVLPEKEIKDISLIICSLIIDWWNMRNYSFSSTEMCYFGHFGDKYEINEIKTIPPPLNNRLSALNIFKIF